MIRRALFSATMIFLASTVAPGHAFGQQESVAAGERWRVLIVPLRAEGINENFGKAVAELVDDAFKKFPTHMAIPQEELSRACKHYGVKCDELNAITSRQMGVQLKAQVVMFGTVKPEGGAYRAEASFTDVKTGEEIRVPPIIVSDRGDTKKVAKAIVSTFQDAVDFQRARVFCQQYVRSRLPTQALGNCDRALEISPTSLTVLYYKGTAFWLLAKEDGADAPAHLDSAATYYRKVLEVEPGHREAQRALQGLAQKRTALSDSAIIASPPGEARTPQAGLQDAFSDDAVRSHIRQHCEREWPDDYQMQVYCVEQATRAVNDLAEFSRNRSTVPEDVWSKILRKCLSDWTPWPAGRGKGETYNYQMVAYCANQQVEAYGKLNR